MNPTQIIICRTCLFLASVFGTAGFTAIVATTQDTFQLISYGTCTLVTGLILVLSNTE